MRGAAEPIDAQPSADRQFGPGQGPVADDACAQERRSLLVAERLRDPVGEVLRHGDELGVPAVAVPAGKRGGQAEVFLAAQAEPAGATGAAQPGHAHPFADAEPGGPRSLPDHLTHYLVARDDPGVPRREVALGQVQVRAAHTADPHFQQDFTASRHRIRAVGGHEGAAGHGPRKSNLPCSHRGLLLCSVCRSESVALAAASG